MVVNFSNLVPLTRDVLHKFDIDSLLNECSVLDYFNTLLLNKTSVVILIVRT